MAIIERSKAFTELLSRTGSTDPQEALAAQRQFTSAIETPLRKGVLNGDITGNIYEPVPVSAGTIVEYPVDLLAPGTEGEYRAYTNPGHGYIPQRNVESDFVTIPTFGIAAAIDFLLRYARDAQWNVVERALQVMEAGFVQNVNDNAWHTLLAAGVDRNILVYDGDASQGQFTKRLVSLMQTVMRRNAGGNTTSVNRGRLTDLYVSPEALEDVRNWGFDQIPDSVRTRIYDAPDGSAVLTDIFGVNLHDLDELGEGQVYQTYFTNSLNGAVEASDVELVVGLDQGANDSFIMPVKETLKVFPDPALHRHQRQGYYGWAEMGFAALDNRRIILGSF